MFSKKSKIKPPYAPMQHITIPGLRLHLRREKVNSMLWVNSQNLLYLNNTAANFIEAFIKAMWKKGKDNSDFSPKAVEDFVISDMRKKYRSVTNEKLRDDFQRVYGMLEGVAKGACPISNLGIQVKEVDIASWSAPARMDLALTYRCDNNCSFCYTGGPQKTEEMTTKQWKKALDILWNVGIPQVVFTGGEPAFRNDLVELAAYAENFVTGLITNGRQLQTLAEDLHKVSLDYAQVSLESASAVIHDKMVGAEGAWKETVKGIEKSKEVGLQVVTNTTLTRENAEQFLATLRFGKELGLIYMSCNSLICSGRGSYARRTDGLTEEELKEVLAKALAIAKEIGIELQWYTPTCYKKLDPMALSFGMKCCSAAQYNMTIEPYGMVIPCQSWLQEKLGNILTDSWTSIWDNPVALNLRNRGYLKKMPECQGCDYIDVCGGGCPLEYRDKSSFEEVRK